MKRIWVLRGGLLGALVLSMSSSATELPSLVNPNQVTGSLIVGRVLTVLTGETSRRHPPEVRFFEFEDQTSQKRFQVVVKSRDRYFVVDLPPGEYRLTRVQISEGPFLSMADLSMAFSVTPSAVTYIGTWIFGVESPRYGRMVVASVIADRAASVRDFLDDQYPTFDGRSMVETLPQPAPLEARLYEVMPYPRYPRYFRRHWW